jgi:hypothetical protein
LKRFYFSYFIFNRKMAHEGDAEVTSDFPPQPKYYLNYGPNGIPLPPPAPPADGTFTLFGEERQLEEETPSLDAQGIKTIFNPKGKKKEELRKLTIASRSRFLQLVDNLAKDADQEIIDQKFQELDTCFINMLYLVNELRATQARVELKGYLKEQIKAKKQAISLLKQTAQNAVADLDRQFSAAGSLQNLRPGDIEMSDSAEQTASGEIPDANLYLVIDEEFKKFI